MDVVVRPLMAADEEQARAAQDELVADDFTFLLEDFDRAEPWTDYLARLDRVHRGEGLAPDRVPATFLVAVVGDDLVGRVSIRHELNDWLRAVGGHIGYGVRPAFRRRGYATQILTQSLAVAHGLGIAQALVTCDDDNVGSATVIERCGGVLGDVVDEPPHGRKRRYWVPTA